MLFLSCQHLCLKIPNVLVSVMLTGSLQLTFLTWAIQPSDLATELDAVELTHVLPPAVPQSNFQLPGLVPLCLQAHSEAPRLSCHAHLL